MASTRAAPAALQRYHPLSIGLHWLMLGVMVATYAFVELRELFPRGTPERAFMRRAHASLGLLVLALVTVRLVLRWRFPAPQPLPGGPPWQRLASRCAHALLYVLMIGMPLGGWLLLSLRGDPILFFGLPLPPLAAENEELAKIVRRWHGDIGRAGYALIGLHAAAALLHHYLWRDDTLRRMLPQRGRA
jgi:cytochrome b561